MPNLKQNQPHYDQITLLTAHSHMDEIKKLHLQGGKTIYAFSTPGVSRVYYNNSGMKMFDLDNKLRVKGYTTYYTTSPQEWGNLHYKSSDIFPNCTNETLPQCLNKLSDEQVCKYIIDGLIYGVKSSLVDNKACYRSYLIPNKREF